MAFSIHFLNVATEYPYDDPSTEAARGAIILGDFREEFLASLHEWTKEDYCRQWKRSIKSLLEGNEKAVLITEYGTPARHASHLVWWVLYRKEENVLVQNQLFFFDDLKGEFNVDRAAEFVNEYQSHSDEGARVSEWPVSMDEVQDFARQLDADDVGPPN